MTEPEKNKWYSPSQRPKYSPDDSSFSVLVWAEWDDGNCDPIWFDFNQDCWMWDYTGSEPTDYGEDFQWHYLPKRNPIAQPST